MTNNGENNKSIVIDGINDRLIHANQQAKYFFAKEEELSKEAHFHHDFLIHYEYLLASGRLPPNKKFIVDVHREYRDKAWAKSDWYYSKACFYSRRIQRLEAKLSAEIRCLDEAKSTPEQKNLNEDFKGEEVICEVAVLAKGYNPSNQPKKIIVQANELT